ncbi:MAG: LysR family transcriptional regulator [Muribaculaceae bacterium]|nr:LysR family transcriptional regulator [Muribaculaceae bacterium]
MELRTLQYFLAVVREENISRAADYLHLTQPTLSRQIAQLEEELGTQLFIRGRHLTLTDAGIMLRHRAEEVVSLMDKIESEFEEQSEVGGIITIGSGGLGALQMLPAVMDSFRQRYPKVQYRFYTNSTDFIKERLDQGLLDFGLLLEPIDISKYDYIRMKEKERWGVLMRTDNPLASKEHITRDDLMGQPLITTERLPLQKELENWMGGDFSKLDIFATYNVITNVTMLISSGVASALTIEGAVSLFGGGLVFRPLYPELSMTSVLAWKKFQPGFGVAGKFLEYFRSMQETYRLA